MNNKYFLVDAEGNFRLNEVGMKTFSPLFSKAGIDVGSIKTYTDYVQARKAASPYFMEYLREETEKRLKGKPNTLEWKAIQSIAFGSFEEQKYLLEKLRKKRNFKVVE